MYFNQYLLRAVDEIESRRARLGYSLEAYTQDLNFGSILLGATNPPYTMCVAAQMEIIVTALNIYCNETGDESPYSYLPGYQWQSLRPGTFKDLLWVNSGSRGTADALEKFGMGEIKAFEDLKPGSFINLNRTNKTGHATLFLGFLDKYGKIVESYDNTVVGFKYYSSQGKKENGGFDYRYAFFDGYCPSLPDGLRRDCGVIRSSNQRYLNTGAMFLPEYWDIDKRDAILKSIHTKSMIENDINPMYVDQITTDD